jgi:hypothetical protein
MKRRTFGPNTFISCLLAEERWAKKNMSTVSAGLIERKIKTRMFCNSWMVQMLKDNAELQYYALSMKRK